MRLAHKMRLFATTTILLIAIPATAASAQTVELLEEGPGGNVHCPPIEPVGAHSATGGCVVHVVGSFTMIIHTVAGAELPVTRCTSEFRARFNEDGEGYLLDQMLVGGCDLEPCDEAAPSHADLAWPAIIYEGQTESGASTEGMAYTFCVTPLTTGPSEEGSTGVWRCTIVIDVFQTGHAQQLATSPPGTFDGEQCAEMDFEVAVEWDTESVLDPNEVEIELVHSD